jgi:hypothetical protein
VRVAAAAANFVTAGYDRSSIFLLFVFHQFSRIIPSLVRQNRSRKMVNPSRLRHNPIANSRESLQLTFFVLQEPKLANSKHFLHSWEPEVENAGFSRCRRAHMRHRGLCQCRHIPVSSFHCCFGETSNFCSAVLRCEKDAIILRADYISKSNRLQFFFRFHVQQSVSMQVSPMAHARSTINNPVLLQPFACFLF